MRYNILRENKNTEDIIIKYFFIFFYIDVMLIMYTALRYDFC